MRGLDPRIHVFLTAQQGVDGRVKPGHDDGKSGQQTAHPSIWVSPQIEIAWPEMVRPRGEHMNTIWSAICCGVT